MEGIDMGKDRIILDKSFLQECTRDSLQKLLANDNAVITCELLYEIATDSWPAPRNLTQLL